MTSEWGTLCLPFDMIYSRNDSYKLYSLTEATANALTFTEYEDASGILAGTPMAIKRISETADNSVTISTTGGLVKTSLSNPTNESAWRLVGTYRTADVPDEGYVISKNMLLEGSNLYGGSSNSNMSGDEDGYYYGD